MNTDTNSNEAPNFKSTVLADCACERNVFLAKMNFGNGNHAFLEVRKALISNKEWIFFIRNENGVHAWHCGSLPLTDCRILEIKEKCVDLQALS